MEKIVRKLIVTNTMQDGSRVFIQAIEDRGSRGLYEHSFCIPQTPTIMFGDKLRYYPHGHELFLWFSDDLTVRLLTLPFTQKMVQYVNETSAE